VECGRRAAATAICPFYRPRRANGRRAAEGHTRAAARWPSGGSRPTGRHSFCSRISWKGANWPTLSTRRTLARQFAPHRNFNAKWRANRVGARKRRPLAARATLRLNSIQMNRTGQSPSCRDPDLGTGAGGSRPREVATLVTRYPCPNLNESGTAASSRTGAERCARLCCAHSARLCGPRVRPTNRASARPRSPPSKGAATSRWRPSGRTSSGVAAGPGGGRAGLAPARG
jgi:hypothetical protein